MFLSVTVETRTGALMSEQEVGYGSVMEAGS
jgi:hypothetical protein